MSSGDLLLRQIEAARKRLQDDIKAEHKLREKRERHEKKWNRIKLTVALLAIVGAMAGLKSPNFWSPAITACFVLLSVALICALCDWNIDL